MVVSEAVRWRVIRAIVGCTRVALAKQLGLNPNSIGQWEAGLHSPNSKSREAYAELCKKHNISIGPNGFPVVGQ